MNLVSKSSQARARNSISRLTTKYNLPDIYTSMWKSFKSFLMFVFFFIYRKNIRILKVGAIKILTLTHTFQIHNLAKDLNTLNFLSVFKDLNFPASLWYNQEQWKVFTYP